MTTSEIIGLVSAIASVIATVVACITCIIHYRFAKPNIMINFIDNPKKCFYVYFETTSGVIERVAYLEARIFNTSAVGGTVARISFNHKGKTYYAEPIGTNISHDWLKINPTNELNQDCSAFKKQLPFVVQPFTGEVGIFVFHDFPVTTELTFRATIEIGFVDSHLKIKREKVIFYDRLRAASGYRFRYEIDDTTQTQ